MKSLLLSLSLILSLAVYSGEVKIQADKTEGCAPLTVNFSSPASGEVVSWSWDFGNGHTSNLQSPSVAFLKPGIYEVNLFVNTHKGIGSAGVIITVNAAPNTDFRTDKTKACTGELINFFSESKPGAAPITKYVWSFGDGKTVLGQKAQHQYSASGDYHVTLVVTDVNGCTADKTSYSSLTVYPKPDAAFTASVESSCNETQNIIFSNLSKGNNLKYAWNFGNGKTSKEVNPSFLFFQGKHDVYLITTDGNGCSDSAVKNISVTKLRANFSSSKEEISTGEAVKFINTSNFKGDKWEWNFGDGTFSTANNPEKIYSKPGTYTVSFKVTDRNCTASETKKSFMNVVRGNPVSFKSDVTSSCNTPVHVKFQNTTPNTAVSLWEFGDGTVSNNPNPEKTFSDVGNFNVTLSVTDSSGHTVKKQLENFIQTAKPMVRFTGDTNVCSGYPIKFTNFTPNGTLFTWNFGDGQTSVEKSPSHVFKQDGYYNVTLTASNGNGCDSSVTMKVHVGPIQADFEVASVSSGVPPFVCTFTNQTPQPNVKYVWDFGDGSSENSANPVHVYDIPGNFKVRLVAYSKSGCSSSKTIEHSLKIGSNTSKAVVHGGL